MRRHRAWPPGSAASTSTLPVCYPETPAAAREIHRCLRPGGVYCIVDPGPAWFNRISAPFAKWSDPGWIGFHTLAEFRSLLLRAGFARFY